MQQIYYERGLTRYPDRSYHLEGLAFDAVFDLFIEGFWEYQKSTVAYLDLGLYWESLSPNNRWGGRYSDGNHFERLHSTRSGPELERLA